MTQDEPHDHPAHAPRRFPRTEVEGRILLRDGSRAVQLEMFDISLGGLQVRAPHPVTVGERRTLLASLEPGVVLELRATVVHCSSWSGQSRKFRVGLEFSGDVNTADTVATLIDHVTAVPLDDLLTASRSGQPKDNSPNAEC